MLEEYFSRVTPAKVCEAQQTLKAGEKKLTTHRQNDLGVKLFRDSLKE